MSPSTASKQIRLKQNRKVALRTADRVIETIRGRDAGRPKGKAARRAARLALPTARELELSSVTRKVEDPDRPDTKVEVQFNRRVDILADEHGHKRISVAAFTVGREIQAAFEAAARSGSTQSFDPTRTISVASSDTMMHVRNLDRARRAQAEMARLSREVGTIGARFLRQILAEGVTFEQYAASTGRGTSERQVAYVADRFRWLLEDIANARAAKGRVG